MIEGLTFDEPNHRYAYKGVTVPGVTQILGDVGLKSNFNPDPKYRARGKAVHKATVLYDQGALDMDACGDTIKGYLQSYAKLFDQFPFVWAKSEEPGLDLRLFVAGTIDRVGHIWRRRCIGDFKTGDPGRSVELQTAAYAQIEDPVGYRDIARYSILLDAKGGPPRVTLLDAPQDHEAWRGVVSLYHWKQRKSGKEAAA